MQRPGFVLFVFIFFFWKEGLACNPEWREYNGKCYLMVGFRSDIRMARRYCAIHGGDLAEIEHPDTFSFMRTLANDDMYDYWIHENSTIPSRFHVSSPYADPHNCIYVTGQQLRSSSCEVERNFICEMEENKEIFCPTSWYLYGTTCYKPMPDNATYEEAGDTCAIQRGSLAIMDDLAKEHEVAPVVLGSNTTLLVGAKASNGTILWSNGKKFSPLDTQFVRSNQTEDCIGFSSSAEHPTLFQWVHLDCDSRNRYLCEIPPTLRPKDLPPQTTTPAPPSTLPPSTQPPLQCPHGFNWKPHTASGYCFWETTYETEKLNWFQARKFCQNVGGDLATYQDSYQESVGLGSAKGHFRGLWFGLSRSTDNVFSWVDGSPLNYTNWNYKEPKLESTTKFCVMHGPDDSEWELDYCGVRRWFVCKAPKTRRVTLPDLISFSRKTPCNFTDSSPYQSWYLFQDHCYLKRESPIYTWHTARDYCQDNNGDLLSVHSFEETDFVIWLLSAISVRNYWMGLSARGIGSNLEWSDGTPLDFLYWPDGQSYNATGEETSVCVSFNSKAGSWEQAHCNEFKTVICKRPLNSSYEFSTPEPTPMLPGYCPQDWFQFGNKCFRVFGSPRSNKQNHQGAVDDCRSADAELASIHSDEEQDFLVDLLLSSDSVAWIGLKRQRQNLFQWSDDSPVDYSRLSSSSSSETATPCVQLTDNVSGNWAWHLAACSERKSYICQKDKDPSLTEPSKDPFKCTNISEWYQLRSTCYGIFETKESSWIAAQRKCREFGADLVTFRNEVVGDFLKKRISKKDNIFWIGVRETVPNTYGLVNGKKLRHSKWLPSQPSQVAAHMQNCVAMNSEAHWMVKECKEHHSFICEWNSDADALEEFVLVTPKSCPNSSDWVDLGNDRCYIFNEDVRRTWIEAVQYCFRHGGHLASIHSEEEQLLIQGHLMKHFDSEEFLVGLAQRNDGSFSWADGSPLDYTNWDSDRSDTFEYTGSCTKMNVLSNLWIPFHCYAKTSGTICSTLRSKGEKLEENPTDFLMHEKQDDISSKLTIGGIFGITICLLVIVVIIAVAAYYMCPSTGMRVPLEESDSL